MGWQLVRRDGSCIEINEEEYEGCKAEERAIEAKVP